MSTLATAISKDDFLSRIWSISTTLTEEAVAAALKKCKEAGFDQDRGLVPLRESFVNLLSARGVLEDVIEKQKLVQLPITIQKELLSNLQTISKSLQGLSDGTDEVVNLTNSIELLNTSIWKYGLHNLSDEVLGYQKKLNQIKNQELQLSKAIAELETAQQAAAKATLAASEVEQKKAEALAALEQVKQSNAASTALAEQIKETGGKTSALHSTIQQQEKQSGELTSSIKTANNELTAIDASIRKFYGEVEEYRRKINQTGEDAASLIRTSEAAVKKLVDGATENIGAAVESLHETERSVTEKLTNEVNSNALETKEALSKLSSETQTATSNFQAEIETKLEATLEQVGTASSKLHADAQAKLGELETKLNQRSSETIETNQKKTEVLIDELAKLKDQIREQIQQATGFQLFGAFQSRQNEIAKSKNRWVWAIAALVVISAGVTIWIAHEAQYYSVNSFAFWVKLSLTVPLGFALTFCTVQYSRERRLEEEYAFKSSISVSLNPYRELIQSIVERGGTDLSKYTDFVIDSVRNVFTPPTDKVFEREKKSGLTEKTLKQTAEIIGSAVKAAK
jgi:chromosome segregation ATPase